MLTGITTKKKSSPLSSWLFWWTVDPQEIQRQVEEYSTLPFHKSARGMAIICLLISSAITCAMIAVGVVPPAGTVDLIVFIVIGILIYRGYRWASLAAMAVWTFEKAFTLFNTLSAGNSGSAVGQVLWWAAFMHAFYLSFRVEQERRKIAKLDTTVFSD